MAKVINYGDFNFLEYGGCLVYPLSSKYCFKILRVETDFDEVGSIYAVLLSVDLTDEWIDKKEILYALGMEDKADLPMEDVMSLSKWASEIVQYYGHDNFAPIFYHNNELYPSYIVTREQLVKWMDDLKLGQISGTTPLLAGKNQKNSKKIYEEFFNRIILSITYHSSLNKSSIAKKAAEDMVKEGLVTKQELCNVFENLSVDQLMDIRDI